MSSEGEVAEDDVLVEGVKSLLDLEDVINSTLNKLHFNDYCNPGRLQHKMRTLERKQREVNRLFEDCDDLLLKYNKDVSHSELEKQKVQTIVCMSDSDDDVEVIDFKPSVAGTPGTPPGGTDARLKAQYKQPTDGMNVSHLQSRQLVSLIPGPMATQGKPYLPQASKTIDLALGMKLFAKKINEIWYKGTLVEVIGKGGPKSQQRYKLKFDGKGMKILSGKHIAFHDHPTEILPVGSRIIAEYRDEDANESFYAGIVAEPPSVRNNHRYLIFFDDGYAQYGTDNDIHRVYEQSKNVWEDIHPDSQEFIKGYLQQYPERPMVRLQKGQIVKTEWNGLWWVARVTEVDASLVKMHFEADRRVEWIYRGSTRLEPLYTELANAEASKAAGKGRRHNLNMKSQHKPIVEYTRGVDRSQEEDLTKPTPNTQLLNTAEPIQRFVSIDSAPSTPVTPVTPQPTDPQKRKPVARKSTANKHRSSEGTPTPTSADGSNQSQWWEKKTGTMPSSNTANKERSTTDVIDLDSEEALGERVGIGNILPTRQRKHFVSHLCGNHCIKDLEVELTKLKGHNPLLFPQLCGWERQIAKQKNTGKRVVFYRSPCGRRMRDTEETDYFLMMTNSTLTIDYFCFDANLHTDTEYVPVKTFCDIKDLSYGKETVPISCVNGIDRQYPDYVEYSNQRIPAKGVKLNLDPEFLSGCSCTDGCRDPTKCECHQFTTSANKVIPSLTKDNPEEIGYEFRRLKEPLVSGIYECNSKCKCDHRCLNRVAQNGLQLRLQVFKTEKRGWGLRCLDDIPEGGFICVYAGQLLTEQGANEDGQQYGDEYLAELDYIEVVERTKEGYESDVNEDEGIAEDSDEEYKAEASDSTYSGERRYKRKTKVTKSVKDCVDKQELTGQQKTADWLSKLTDNAIVISDEEEQNARRRRGKATKVADEAVKAGGDAVKPAGDAQADNKGLNVLESGSRSDLLPDLANAPTEETKCVEELGGLKITEPTSLNTDDVELEEESDDETTEKKDIKTTQPRRSTRTTTGTSRFRNLPDPKSQKPVSPLKINLSSMQITKKEDKKNKAEKKSFNGTRNFFGEEFSYVMDAKSMGNLGRYLNHNCSPNVFVQNVFVDTHDLRFPWVAFFAYTYIRAGTELTWDYNYEVGSVPGKVLYCYCGSAECRGRLL